MSKPVYLYTVEPVQGEALAGIPLHVVRSKRWAVHLAERSPGRCAWSWRDGERHKLVHPVDYDPRG